MLNYDRRLASLHCVGGNPARARQSVKSVSATRATGNASSKPQGSIWGGHFGIYSRAFVVRLRLCGTKACLERGSEGSGGGWGQSQHCLNNEVECVDKFICLICVWHAIFKFAPSPKPATVRVATHSFPPHSFSRSAYPRDAACCVERRISSTCSAMGSSMGNGSARNYAGLPSSGI